MILTVEPLVSGLKGEITPPGDKSISHRALIFASLASGRSVLHGVLMSEDTLATLHACQQLGASIEHEDGTICVTGTGGDLTRPSGGVLDMGNSGTAMRLLAGVLAGQRFDCVLGGDESLNSRPMRRIVAPLTLMGAEITTSDRGTAPLHISAGRGLNGIDYTSPVASAQVKSCVLLAGLFAHGQTRVLEPRLSRDHTERMLPLFGVNMPSACTVNGGSKLKAASFTIPGDISSAVFLMAAAAMNSGSEIIVKGVGLNAARSGLLVCMEEMGAAINIRNQTFSGTEPVADIQVVFNGPLAGIDVPESRVPDMIDELPVLMALAATAKGITRIRGAAELRVKESDRISVMAGGLQNLGVSLKEYPDGIDIRGGSISGGRTDCKSDHRCAMSFALLGLVADNRVQVQGAEFIATSYPGFGNDLVTLGAAVVSGESA